MKGNEQRSVRIARIVAKGVTGTPSLVRIQQGVLHELCEHQDFMHLNQDGLSSPRIVVHRCDFTDRNVLCGIARVTEGLCVADLASVTQGDAVLAGTGGVGVVVNLHTELVEACIGACSCVGNSPSP